MINVIRYEPPLTFEIIPVRAMRMFKVQRSDSNCIRMFPSLDKAESYARKAAVWKRARIVWCDEDGFANRQVEVNE